MTKYARDEFDRVPEASTRQGVHRTVAAPGARRLGPVLATGAAALVVGLVAFLLLPNLGFGPAGGSAMTADQASNNAAASQAPTTAAAGSTPSASSTPTGSLAPAASKPTPSATPSATRTGAVDKTQPVAVYNATGTAGLAGRIGSTVTAAGWAAGPLGNWGGAPQQTSVVFYNGPAQKANAEELGSLLGIGTLVDSAEFQMPLVIVLGPGFN
ncbi:LytR C-terminal domain-containing protein [Arthrobacter sp. C9C5]|uniref:LytR C-terminal domain-containing protein n=1 Tax=Arthrobacter sp. C9C5 TaxID=2735267 RepID=UPI0015853F6E|nr:LytR C-terminal domain-containing protein [Arthrobacter sp. C9C5]NUU31230.1 LytR C-terminal domain-containing protein [Arthrobacter sp. C9C5]